MDIRHLRQILAVRDHGSFAKAADALHIAQPALSKSIARIEHELRLTIFSRTASGSELTPIGEMIAERAERVMAANRSLARDAALAAGGDAGTVRLGMGTLLKDTLLPRLLTRIVQAHPQLRLEIEVGASNRLLPLVQSREIDLAVCAADAAPASSGLTYVKAMSAELVFVAAPGHPLASERSISIDRLSEFPCAGPNVPGNTAAELLRRPGCAENLNAYMANNYDALMPIVQFGRVALIAPDFAVEAAIRSGEVVRLDVDWQASSDYGCYTTQAASFSPVLAEITRCAVEAARTISRE
jgi:DNA-binding transcriptional LysR family regulator